MDLSQWKSNALLEHGEERRRKIQREQKTRKEENTSSAIFSASQAA